MDFIKNKIKKFLFFFENSNKKIYLEKNVVFSLSTVFEGKNKINRGSNISESFIGYGTYIGSESIITDTFVGRYCSIADGVKVVHGFHPTNIFVSTHPAFYSLLKQSGFTYVENQLFEERRKSSINPKFSLSIGNDVWIGSNALILEGLNLADGTVVAAGSVVTRDTEAYGIYAGVPAKLIKKRFEDKEINYLLKTKWWNWKEETIQKNIKKFNDIKIFVKEEIE